MRSGLTIFFLLVVAFMQGMTRIDAHASNQTRAAIDAQIQSQR